MADEEEDWFESALKEEAATDDPGEEAATDDPGEEAATDLDGDGTQDDTPTDEPADGAAGDGATAVGEAATDGATGDDASGDGATTDAFEFDAGGDPGADGPPADDPVPDDDVAPIEDSPGDVEHPPGGDGKPFAGGEAVSGPFADDESDGFGADAGDGDLFDQDFASAFEGAGGTDGEAGGMGDSGFGFDLEGGGGGGFDAGEFDDESFESDIPRIELGIEGLDEMIQGGVPERSLMVVMGSAGTGKTTFGLQFLERALADGESAVFITLEETRSRILSTAVEKGWDFEGYEDAGRLAIVDLDPIEMANSLTSIRNELPALVEEFDASRLVLDSVSLLEMMYDDQATRRTEVYDFTKSLKSAGVTTMLTSEASEDTPFASRYGIIEYLTDAVFVLRYVRPEDFRETRLAVEIQKIRDANHSRETKPYEITNEGISVYRQANIF